MREAVVREHGRGVLVAAAARVSGRGWGLPLHPRTDAETTAQMSRVRSMTPFLIDKASLTDDWTGLRASGSSTFELVAKPLHRVQFRASQKGSQDKYLGVCAMALTVE